MILKQTKEKNKKKTFRKFKKITAIKLFDIQKVKKYILINKLFQLIASGQGCRKSAILKKPGV